jgi:hypothetical protein
MHLRLTILILIQLILLRPLAGQEEFIEPPSRFITRTDFTQLTGGVILLRAILDNYPDSLNFILDTGSGGISLDSSTVAELGLHVPAPERIIRGIGGIRKVGFLKNHKLTIGSLVADSLNFHVIDYDMLSSLYGDKIDGIIGYSLFSRYIVRINYDNDELSFWTNGSLKYPKGGHLILPRIGMLPVHNAETADSRPVNFNYLFDIGAGLTVLFSDDFVEDSAFIKTKRKRYLKQGEGLGGRVDMFTTVCKELKIGPYKFRNVPINIFRDDFNITSYPLMGGLIGNDIFRRFNCIINYNKRQIHLTPNTHFREPFDYAYSGIELYLIDGKIKVGAIPKGSPAEKAGFQEGDEVIAVNNRFGLYLKELKQELQSATGRVRVIIRRGDQLQMKSMKVINILR